MLYCTSPHQWKLNSLKKATFAWNIVSKVFLEAVWHEYEYFWYPDMLSLCCVVTFYSYWRQPQHPRAGCWWLRLSRLWWLKSSKWPRKCVKWSILQFSDICVSSVYLEVVIYEAEVSDVVERKTTFKWLKIKSVQLRSQERLCNSTWFKHCRIFLDI